MKTIVLAAFGFVVATPSLAGNLLLNGGFEAPGGIVRSYLNEGYIVPGWTYDRHSTGIDVYEDDGEDGLTASEGSHYVSFGHVGTTGGELYQTVWTSPGYSYRLSLFAAEQQGDDPLQQFHIALSTNAGDRYDFYVDHLTRTFQQKVWNVVLNGESTTISIQDNTPIGFGIPSNLALDAVSLTASVPEPAPWALMIGGFGLIGAAFRRRVTGTVAA